MKMAGSSWSTLLLSKIDPACAVSLEVLSKQRASSAAEAGTENKLVIAAVNRCATQNQTQNRVFPQSIKSMLKKFRKNDRAT